VADEPPVSQRILERLMLGRVCGPYPRGKTGWCRTEESGASPGPSVENNPKQSEQKEKNAAGDERRRTDAQRIRTKGKM